MSILEIYSRQAERKETLITDIDGIEVKLKEVEISITEKARHGIEEPRKLLKDRDKLREELRRAKELEERLTFDFTLQEVKNEMWENEKVISEGYGKIAAEMYDLADKYVLELEELQKGLDSLNEQIYANKRNYEKLAIALGFQYDCDFNPNGLASPKELLMPKDTRR